MHFNYLFYIRFTAGASIAAMLAFGVHLQSQVLINHDVGWVTNSAARLLDGAEFGRDIFAANPPLIWWLSVPAAAVARFTPLSEVQAIRLFVWAACVWSVWMSFRLLRHVRGNGQEAESTGILLALSFVLFLLPGAIFAQREHITFAFTAPYALLVGLHSMGAREPRRRDALVTGILAGIGIALKPYFLLLPILLEAAHAASRRSARAVIRIETMAIAGVMILYLVCVALFAREYLTNVLPVVRTIYWAFESNNTPVLYAVVAPAIWTLLIVLGMALVTRSAGPLHVSLAAMVIAFLGSYWLQAKGYEYHAYPASAAAIVLLTLAAISSVKAAATRLENYWVSLRVAAILVIVAIWAHYVVPRGEELGYWYSRVNIQSGDIARDRLHVIEAVSAHIHSPTDCVYAFSTHPYPGFPTMNYLNARWGARSNSQFAIPAIIRRRLNASVAPGLDLHAAERFTREVVLEDFLRCPPRVVMVGESKYRHALGLLPYDEIQFFSEDPRFAEIWKHYTEVEVVGNVRLFFMPSHGGKP